MVQSLDDARRRASVPGGRVPPHNLEAEESLLGAMLLSRDAIASAVEQCGPDDFYKPAHGHVFEVVSRLFGHNEPADTVTVNDELARAGLLEAIGGSGVLVSLQARAGAITAAPHYARIVSEHALLRRMIGVAGEIAELGYSLPDDVIGALDQAEHLMFDVSQRKSSDTVSMLRDLLGASLDRLQELYDRGESITGVPTGYYDLDEKLSGLQGSNLVIVGARPAMGKTAFALGMAAHAAMEAHVPTLFFSLEMSPLDLTQRVLSAEARVESTRMRSGRLLDDDWTKISHAIGRLAEAPLYIDENPYLTVMDIRAKARRMMSREGLGLVIVDYLQLMSGRGSAENRQVEISEISRGLKILARELKIPVVALSQLSRGLEQRHDKRPSLADLRESGCVTADTRILRADTGAEVTIGELYRSGERDIPVWSIDEDLKMVKSTMTHTFSSGIKEIFEMRLASGRTIKASANHPFLTIDGWTRLDELSPGSRLAIPRHIPEPPPVEHWPDAEVVMLGHLLGDGCVASRQPVHYTSEDPENLDAVEAAAAHFGITPRRVQQENWWHTYLPAPYHLTHGKRNPIQQWLSRFGLDGKRGPEKFIPREVFGLPREQVVLFFHHLWATDGSITWDDAAGQARMYYSSKSLRLAEDVQSLLLRLGIVARRKTVLKKGYDPNHHVHIYGAEQQLRFLSEVGCNGARGNRIPAIIERLKLKVPNTNVDTVPRAVWSQVKQSMAEHGVTSRALAAGLGTAYCGSTLYKHSPSRERLGRVAALLDDDNLYRLAASDLFWDEVVSIESLGEEEVYDATVLDTHNFIGNGIVVENSLEQDADVVLFIYRDEIYNPDSPDRGMAEIIVSKHRNGPTGKVNLAFLDHFTRFHNLSKGV